MDNDIQSALTSEYTKSLNEDVCIDTLKQVVSALSEKGYDPINQIVGYLISGDPTYITNYKNARFLMSTIERDEIMGILVRSYIDTNIGISNE